MKDQATINREYFVKRLAILCLKSGLSGFPKDETDRHILLKSAALTFDPSRAYSSYWVSSGRAGLFEVEVDQVDPLEEITEAKQEIEARKRAFMEKRK
jgi:hypothetical protein